MMSTPSPRPTIESLDLENKEQIPIYLELIRIIEKDIDEIKAGDTRNGWTSWAIIGGIAAALLLLFGETRKLQSFPTEEVKTIVLGGLLFFNVVAIIFRIPNLGLTGTRPGRVRWSKEVNYSYIPRMIFFFVALLVLIYVAFTLTLTAWMKIFILVTLILWALYALSILIFIFANIPLGNNKQSKKVGWGILLVLLPLAFVSSLILITRMTFPLGEANTQPYILAGLIIALLLLVDNLISTTSPSRLLSNLYDLRNDIIFLRIDIDEALQRYEILTEGETLPDALKVELGEILNDLNFIDYAHANMSALIDKMRQEIPEPNDSGTQVAEKLKQLALDKDSYLLHDMKTVETLKAQGIRLQKLDKKMSQLGAVSEDRASEYNIRALLATRMQLLNNYHIELTQRFQEINQTLSNRLPIAQPTEQQKPSA